MIEDCKTDDTDSTDVRGVSSPMGVLRDLCRITGAGRSGWADEVRDALACVLPAQPDGPARAGRIGVARERVLAAVDAADLDALRGAVDRLEALLGVTARVPDPTVRATAPGPPGTLVR